MLRLSGTSSTSSAAGTMRLKRLIKPPAQPVVLDLTNFHAWETFFHERIGENGINPFAECGKSIDAVGAPDVAEQCANGKEKIDRDDCDTTKPDNTKRTAGQGRETLVQWTINQKDNDRA